MLQSLIDDIINSINNLIYQGISSLEEGLLSQPPERLGFKPSPDVPPSTSTSDENENDEDRYPHARLEIENGLHQLETLLESTVDKNFDKLELYVLRNILTVSEELVGWVRLGCYEDLKIDGKEVMRMEELMGLRRKVVETLKLNRALEREKRRNGEILRLLREMLGQGGGLESEDGIAATAGGGEEKVDLEFLMKGVQPTEGASLTTSAKFTLSQMPAMRATLRTLRPQLRKLQQSGGVVEMELDEEETDRREYVESGAGKAMERVMGKGVAETVQVQGVRREKEEVEALERLMGTWEGT
jgi:kinetochore protein Mis12/MTW1